MTAAPATRAEVGSPAWSAPWGAELQRFEPALVVNSPALDAAPMRSVQPGSFPLQDRDELFDMGVSWGAHEGSRLPVGAGRLR